jgi:4-amino-4-deoxychorismate lyase
VPRRVVCWRRWALPSLATSRLCYALAFSNRCIVLRSLINGEASDRLTCTDRGLHYGDGVFETLAVRHGRPEFWQRHMERLRAGCARLGFTAPALDLLALDAERLCVGVDLGVLKIMVTRGVGGRGYRPPVPVSPQRLLMLFDYPIYSVEASTLGVDVRVCRTRMGCNPALAGMKHLNRLEQVLARAEWEDDGVAEGLMLDAHDNVVEGIMSNVFFVRDGVLSTPDLSQCGVAGVMRGVVLELAAHMGIPVHIDRFSLPQVWAADEVFLTNSLLDIWPVRRIGEHQFVPGPITQQMALHLREVARI